jgi:hypothetical protein
MEKEGQALTPDESIRLITEMIQHAKGNVQRNNFYFLLWGWVIVLANIGHYSILKFTAFKYPYIVWLIAIPAYIISIWYGLRNKSKRIMTHLDRIHSLMWTAFGVCIPVLVFFGYKINFNINPLILLIAALPTFLSGVILNFKPLVWGGVLFWIFAVVSFVAPYEYQYPLTALAIIGGYIIPGYLLKQQEAKNVQRA